MVMITRPRPAPKGWLGTIVPDVDDLKTNWADESLGTTNIYTSIDDPAINDADYIQTDEILLQTCASKVDRDVRFFLSAPGGTVGTGSGQVVNVRARLNGLDALNCGDMLLRLYNGTTLVIEQSFTHTLTTSFVTWQWALDNTEKAAMVGVWNGDARLWARQSLGDDTGGTGGSVIGEISEMWVDFI